MRRYRLYNLLAAVTAVSLALITLLGLFVEDGGFAFLVAVLLQTVVVVLAIAVLVGLLNLLRVHLGRMRRLEKGWFYSLLVLLSFGAVLAVRLLDPRTNDGSEQALRPVLFETLQTSIQSALAGLIFFFLVYAAYRLLRERLSGMGLLFTGVLLVALLGALPLEALEPLQELRDWLYEVPATAGARGLLIGVSIATVTASLRVLIGQERAYRE